MPLTLKQAQAYIKPDSGNWTLVETTEEPHPDGHLRLYVLTYENITFARLDVLVGFPSWLKERGKNYEPRWRTELYYTIEGDSSTGEHLVYTVRPTEMARTIWEKSKA